jgi:hypothetical protein
MTTAVLALPFPQEASAVPDNMDMGAQRSYVRCNQTMSKQVYRAQVVREVFGAGAARMFMRLMRVDTGVAQRVLRSPMSRLRR